VVVGHGLPIDGQPAGLDLVGAQQPAGPVKVKYIVQTQVDVAVDREKSVNTGGRVTSSSARSMTDRGPLLPGNGIKGRAWI